MNQDYITPKDSQFGDERGEEMDEEMFPYPSAENTRPLRDEDDGDQDDDWWDS